MKEHLFCCVILYLKMNLKAFLIQRNIGRKKTLDEIECESRNIQKWLEPHEVLTPKEHKQFLILLQNLEARLEELSTPELINSCVYFIEHAEDTSCLAPGYMGQKYLQARAIINYGLGNYQLAACLAGVTANVWTCRCRLFKTEQEREMYSFFCQFASECYTKCGDKTMADYLLSGGNVNRHDVIFKMITEIQFIFPILKSRNYEELQKDIKKRLCEFYRHKSFMDCSYSSISFIGCEYRQEKLSKRNIKSEIRDHVLLFSLNKDYFERMTLRDLADLISFQRHLPEKDTIDESRTLTKVFKQHIDVLKTREESMRIKLSNVFHLNELMPPAKQEVESPAGPSTSADEAKSFCRIL